MVNTQVGGPAASGPNGTKLKPPGVVSDLRRRTSVPARNRAGILDQVRTDAGELTQEEMIALLRAAQDDEREGRLVRCTSEAEMREFFAGLRTGRG